MEAFGFAPIQHYEGVDVDVVLKIHGQVRKLCIKRPVSAVISLHLLSMPKHQELNKGKRQQSNDAGSHHHYKHDKL